MTNTLLGRKRIRKFRRLKRGYYAFLIVAVAYTLSFFLPLLANGKAYESDGSLYYRIAAFPDYGKLSKISFEGNIAGGSDRVDTDKYDKEDARDFALWKLVGPDDEPGWDAPFGRGRPGSWRAAAWRWRDVRRRRKPSWSPRSTTSSAPAISRRCASR